MSSVNARGRALNAAMSSLHSFDRSLDKFMAWLSDAESALESLELELDSYGPGVKTSRERVLMQLKVGWKRNSNSSLNLSPALSVIICPFDMSTKKIRKENETNVCPTPVVANR